MYASSLCVADILQRDKLLAERDEFVQKHEELTDTVQRLNERTLGTMSPLPRAVARMGEDVEGLSHSRTNSATNLFHLQMSVTAKDRQIEALQSQVQDMDAQMRDLDRLGDPRLLQLETKLKEYASEIRSLRDDNESYQTLLHDKTVTGEFSKSSFMQSTSSRPRYESLRGVPQSLDLASELGSTAPESAMGDVGRAAYEASLDELVTELQKSQETNKALSLYINTIVARMLNTDGFEHLLAKDISDMEPKTAKSKKLAEKLAEPTTPSFLQRTRSVLTRRSANQEESNLQVPARNPEMTNVTTREDGKVSARPPSADGSESDAGLFTNPFRSSSDTSTLTARRTLSPSTGPVLPHASPTKVKGLRPLTSVAVADQISTREARRLSAQFAPLAEPDPKVGADSSLEEGVKRGKRNSWIGWLGSKTETAADTGKNPASLDRIPSVGEQKKRTGSELRPLAEIDQEIDREINADGPNP